MPVPRKKWAIWKSKCNSKITWREDDDRRQQRVLFLSHFQFPDTFIKTKHGSYIFIRDACAEIEKHTVITRLLTLVIIIASMCVCVCACAHMFTCVCMLTSGYDFVELVLPFSWILVTHSRHQAVWQAPLPSEASHQPSLWATEECKTRNVRICICPRPHALLPAKGRVWKQGQ